MATAPPPETVAAEGVRIGAEPDPYAHQRRFFDDFAAREEQWRGRTRGYHRLIEQITRFHIPRGARVLEIGSGSGDLLAALEPRVGVGVDISPGMVELARRRHPELRFEVAAGEDLDLGETFDYIVLSDLVPFVHDLVALFNRVAAHSHERTRIVVSTYSRAWRPLIRLGELLRMKPVKPVRNWVAPHDIRNLLELSGLEQVTSDTRLLFPFRLPLLSSLLNGVLGSLWPIEYLCLTYWATARPRAEPTEELPVSIVCPCRNEEGHVPDLVTRTPGLGPETELIFVEGGSTDDTRGEIERQISANPDRHIRLVDQPGKGKGDAVRAGFAAARHEVLMILDGDLSVRPEDLPKFYRALIEGRGELINGSRLVYDVEPGAMRFLNMLGNRIFSRLVKWITGQQMKDTLCGTKVLLRSDYDRIAGGREYFGEFDPFGDFDLLYGAARLGMKVIDLPVRYQPRVYGETNISRWRHGLLLFRMTVFAFWKFRVAPVSYRGQ